MCEAHEMLVNEVNRVKDDISELYNLDRKKIELMSDIQQQVTAQGKEIDVMHEEITELKEQVRKVNDKVEGLDNKVDKLDSSMTLLQTNLQEVKQCVKNGTWTPKEKVLLITSIIGFLSAVTVAIIGVIF